MVSEVRVRYAPSPTGDPHVGNIRTALFDWLYAKNKKGKFIVRVEDTDQNRKISGSIHKQENVLRWLGLSWDEGMGIEGEYGPYVQSERLEIYSKQTDYLLHCGKAYRCYCTSERLKELREEQKMQKASILGYDGKCRKLTDIERSRYEDEGLPYVIRFAMPDSGLSSVKDLIRGEIEFDNSLADDFILLKADGFPTYHLASVVDDHFMGITHVFRGEEWVSSVPRHIQLYEAFNWDKPFFAHLPTILAPDRSKLSKRHGATSVLEYKKMGYLPQAMVNFLSLLGWSLDGDTTIISIDQLVDNFDPSRISASGAIFDIDKLDWMNGQYIRNMREKELGEVLFKYWNEYPPNEFERSPGLEETTSIASMVKERLGTLSQAAPLVAFLFKKNIEYNPETLVQKGMNPKNSYEVLQKSYHLLSNIDSFDSKAIEHHLRALSSEIDIKIGQLLGTIRVATSGQKVSPPLFESLELLGRDRVKSLLQQGMEGLDDIDPIKM